MRIFAQNLKIMKWSVNLKGQLRDDLVVGAYSGDIYKLPEHTTMPTYGLQFLFKGTIRLHADHRDWELKAPCVQFIFNDHVVKLMDSSTECEICGLALSPQFGESMETNIPHNLLSRLYTHPIWHIDETRISIVKRYFEMLRCMVPMGNRPVIINLLRSLFYFLAEDLEQDQLSPTTMTRAEQIAGQFLALVEKECRSHHRIEWYANQMCLTPKYVANVVRQVNGLPAGQCIDNALVRQARSLLLTTPYSIQEIAHMLGFLNQSHFGTFFRRETGVSPKNFRIEH